MAFFADNCKINEYQQIPVSADKFLNNHTNLISALHCTILLFCIRNINKILQQTMSEDNNSQNIKL